MKLSASKEGVRLSIFYWMLELYLKYINNENYRFRLDSLAVGRSAGQSYRA